MKEMNRLKQATQRRNELQQRLIDQGKGHIIVIYQQRLIGQGKGHIIVLYQQRLLDQGNGNIIVIYQQISAIRVRVI